MHYLPCLILASFVLSVPLGALESVPSPAAVDENTVDVSHGIGIPFGGIGTGYSVFGKYGFVRLNVDGMPDPEHYRPREPAGYVEEPAAKAPFCFVLDENSASTVLQQKPVAWLPQATPVESVACRAYLPKGFFAFRKAGLGLTVTMTGFSPMVPYDLAGSSVPVQVFELTVENPGVGPRDCVLRLAHAQPLASVDGVAVLKDAHGQMAFAADDGRVDAHGVAVPLHVEPGQRRQARFYIAWYYPAFQIPNQGARPDYVRLYTRRFADAAAVIAQAKLQANAWSQAIDRWHDSFDVPAYFKRLWFSSLSSVIGSVMLGADNTFFEIETPHAYVNTMDVTAYSNWLYLINWPEIERMDMDQFFSCIPTAGERKGFVWHSLWSDAADYVEEPTFLVRLWRDHLWFNDLSWLAKGFAHAVNAANRVYAADGYESLINSKHGNQSYDVWKMPGVGSYVNSAWIYGLHGLERMSAVLQQPVTVGGMPVAERRAAAVASYDRMLWNQDMGCWNCFARAPGSAPRSIPDSIFTDQLFGRWMLLIDPAATGVLPEDKVCRTLGTIYRHNLLTDAETGFRGWTNGRQRDGAMDPSGAHAQTCWICAQTDLGSLLGEAGDEAASLDVFRSLEGSLRNNHLAVGEWNQAMDPDGYARTLREEPGKDTPRFVPYPRYKCAWEYLIRIMGLKMDATTFQLSPFTTIPFKLTGIRLAGTTWTVSVCPQWKRAMVDGVEVPLPVRIERSRRTVTVEFVP